MRQKTQLEDKHGMERHSTRPLRDERFVPGRCPPSSPPSLFSFLPLLLSPSSPLSLFFSLPLLLPPSSSPSLFSSLPLLLPPSSSSSPSSLLSFSSFSSSPFFFFIFF